MDALCLDELDARRSRPVRDADFMRIVGEIDLHCAERGVKASKAQSHETGASHVVEGIVVTLVLVALVALIACGVAFAQPASSAPSTTAVAGCSAIHYVLNLDNAPAGARDDVDWAMARVTEASGFTFQFDGVTSEAPSASRATLPVLVAWSAPEVFAAPDDRARLAGWTTTEWSTSTAGAQLVSGSVYLNAAQDRPTGVDDRTAWRGVLLHEFGHLVGLDHSADEGQVMFPELLPGPAQWGAQDLAALKLAAGRAGCHPAG